MKWLLPILAPACLTIATGCTFINDSRSSSVVQAPEGQDGELLTDVSRLEHTLWDNVLADYASTTGVDYSELLRDGEARYALRQYVRMLGQIDPRGLADRDEKLAFYVNLYNSNVVAGALDRLAETPDFRVDEDAFLFFDEPLVSFEGLLISLNVVEHALVRGDLGHSSSSVSSLDPATSALVSELHDDLWDGEPFDPRIHFLLNCASRSCPALQPYALTGAVFEDTAEAATEAFLLDETKGAGGDGISRLFDWFISDFSAAGFASPSDFIGAYRDLDGVDTGTFLPYDWALNQWDRS